MTFWEALGLGVVEGVTEFLPISSTGHLILVSSWWQIPQTEFVKSFEIAIQLGAILAVVALYWRTLLVNRQVLWRVLVAFLPTALLGLVFYRLVKNHLLGRPGVVIAALLIGGIGLIVFESWHKRKRQAEALERGLADLSYGQAALIGLAQSAAMIPGVSRSAATIIGGLWLGLSRRVIVQFSFLLAVPTMLGATGLDLFQSGYDFTPRQWQLLGVGFVVAFVVALGSIKFLLNYIKKYDFIPFGIYRIVVALIMLLVLF